MSEQLTVKPNRDIPDEQNYDGKKGTSLNDSHDSPKRVDHAQRSCQNRHHD